MNRDVAIIGIGLRLPGGVRTPESFWEMLLHKKDGRCQIPEDRYHKDGFYSASKIPGTICMEHGYFLQDTNLKHFDASFFSMSKKEVECLDPQQRLLLEVVWECMENGGQANWRGTDIACYVGVFGEDMNELSTKSPLASGTFRMTGAADFAISNRISYEYDLHGPSMTIRTACSSSLTALHEACCALSRGECPGAIVAGTNIIISPTMTIAMSAQGVVSPDGMSKTFDESANGYARGEAINSLFLKRLDDALRDGDPIRGVIRGTHVNCDGKTPGLYHPSSEAQERLIRRTYEVAGIEDITKTAFIECHGTGTSLGDPLEVTAIANVFGHGRPFIGSVKPNVGHSEGASGITSVIKAVLSLENNTIPPNINFKKPNPKAPIGEGKLQVPLEATPWPAGKAARVSVNSFGLGGSNAHVIIDSAADFRKARFAQGARSGPTAPRLLVLSANNAQSLSQRAIDISRASRDQNIPLDSLAYTLASRRDHLAHRTYYIADQDEKWEMGSSRKSSTSSPSVCFVFPGQGSQWDGMGRALFKQSTVYRETVQGLDTALQRLNKRPKWKLAEIFRGARRIDWNDPEFSQPLITAVQVGLIDVLSSWGIHPSCLVGHSSGEIAAGYAAGGLTAEEAIIVAFYRGQVSKYDTQCGAMAAVGLGRDDITPFCEAGIALACENSPCSVTISGDIRKVKDTLDRISQSRPGVFTRRLQVNKAYHSDQMLPAGPQYEQDMDPYLQPKPLRIPFYSTVLGRLLHGGDMLSASYWRENLESTVRFHPAVKAMLEDYTGHDLVVLEVGPHSALAGPVYQILATVKSDSSRSYLPTLKRGKNCCYSILKAVGELWALGHNFNIGTVNPPTQTITNLPLYPWGHGTEYWHEDRLAQKWRRRHAIHHELLGSLTLESTDIEPSWRNIIRLDDVKWLASHRVYKDIVFPVAGYIGMIGEALRQLSGMKDYTIKHLVVNNALVIEPSDSGIELLTSVRPSNLTSSAKSSWYEWSISSYNGSLWTEHCAGVAKPGNQGSGEIPADSEDNVRPVGRDSWYHKLAKIGLNYGVHFQGLHNINAHPLDYRATAHVNCCSNSQSLYALHPASIDCCLQLFTVSAAHGLTQKILNISLPVAIDHIYIHPAQYGLDASARVETTPRGGLRGNVIGSSGDQLAIAMRGCRFVSIEQGDESSEGLDSLSGAHLEWLPDFGLYAAHKKLLPMRDTRRQGEMDLFENSCDIYILSIVDILPSIHVPPESYLNKYVSWLRKHHELIVSQKHRQWDPRALEPLLKSVEGTVTGDKESDGVLFLLKTVFRHVREILSAQINPLDQLVQENALTNLYNYFQRTIDYSPLFRVLGHSNPGIRILEIGAGTGGFTTELLKGLVTAQGSCLYRSYTYTDVSAGFLAPAMARFNEYADIEYRVLDIGRDPVEQGFSPDSFDLVVASNVLHATESVRKTLGHVRQLLRPGGYLFLQELCPTTKWINFIMGTLPGWWLGGKDNRLDEPFINPDKWQKELRRSGFSNFMALVYDSEHPYQLNANMLVERVPDTEIPTRQVTLLYDTELCPFGASLQDLLNSNGVEAISRMLTADLTLPPNSDVIVTIDVENNGPYLDDITATKWTKLRDWIVNLQLTTGVLWLARSAQLKCIDPRHGLMLGLTRTVSRECGIPLLTFELDRLDQDALHQVLNLYRRNLQNPLNVDPAFPKDREFILFEGVVHTGRFHPTMLRPTERLPQVSSARNAGAALALGQYGKVSSLSWQSRNVDAPLGDHEVEVQVHFAGLNFKDVLLALGIVDGPKDQLGLEGSGIVLRAGTKVTHVKIGDPVFVMRAGCFSTAVVVPEDYCVRIPEGLTLQEAATMPCVYTTVIHALIGLGRLERGQSVLIQSACGGVGLAAIHVCQSLGADIYTTVGSEYKVSYLTKNFNIPRSRIFNSRDTSFAADLMCETNGRGVDVVLNSLSGELLHAAWDCVAEFGKMLELGKRDFLGRGYLQMFPFSGNRTFHGVDLATLSAKRPLEARRLLEQCAEFYSLGLIQPIPIQATFSRDNIHEAFRTMQKGQHIGKIIVDLQSDASNLSITPIAKPTQLSSDGSYLLVGGLGGLGVCVTNWMIERGAKHFVFLSPSAGQDPKHKSFFHELEVQGCTAAAIAGSAADLDDVKNAVSIASGPILGVINMAMVLKDKSLSQISYDDLIDVFRPKVQGTWNLHRVLQGEPNLQFFVLFSSISGLFGQSGQANYSSANTFLDSFAQYRHSLGLPASVVDLGPVGDVGYLARNSRLRQRVSSLVGSTLDERDVLAALQIAIDICPPEIPQSQGPDGQYININQHCPGFKFPAQADISGGLPPWWHGDARMGLYRNIKAGIKQRVSDGFEATTTNDSLEQFIGAVVINPKLLSEASSVDLLTKHIGDAVCVFLVLKKEELDVHQPLSEVGLDSLVSIELRNWWTRVLKLEVSALEILNAGTTHGLGRLAVRQLREKYSQEEDKDLPNKAP